MIIAQVIILELVMYVMLQVILDSVVVGLEAMEICTYLCLLHQKALEGVWVVELYLNGILLLALTLV